VLDAVPCRIVISSAWGNAEGRTVKVLTAAGFRHGDRVVGCTSPTCEDADRRGHEIGEWLSRHPGVTHFVILDDGDDMGPLRRHLVQTTWAHGLEECYVPRLISLLRGETPARLWPRRVPDAP
jgi:hypothetical protein